MSKHKHAAYICLVLALNFALARTWHQREGYKRAATKWEQAAVRWEEVAHKFEAAANSNEATALKAVAQTRQALTTLQEFSEAVRERGDK